MKRILAAGAAALAFAAGAGILALYVAPFQTVELLRKAALLRGGVRRVRAGTLNAYEKDLCEAGKPCRCVALIHGLGDSALTWDNVLLGKKGAAPPRAGYRYLAVELPGSEGSQPPAGPEGYRIPAMADAVGDALATRCSSWTVVGNSLGGWIAATLALRRPALVERLLLVNNAGVADPTGQLVKVARLLGSPTVELMKSFAQLAYHSHASVPERAWPAVIASIRARPTARIVAALRESDLLDGRLAGIRAPTTVLWGQADRAVPAAEGEAFARGVPGARWVPAADCGHLPQQECPAAVTDALYGTPRP